MDKKRNIIIAVVLIIILVGLIALSGFFNDGSNNQITNPSGNKSTISANTILSQDDLFTDRDLKQEADQTGATKYEVEDNTDISITKEGVYVIGGTAENVTINVEAGDDEKVQIVLDNLNLTNKDKECIHVENADKVFFTTNTQSSLKYSSTNIENATGAILSRSDITFNGKGTLDITSDNNGIIGKDDVKITGGTYNITTSKNCVRANDSIRIAGGTLNLKAGTDGLHAENSDDDTKGYIYINSCTLNIDAEDDAIHALSVVQINGGTININAGEAIEGTYIQINDGTISIEASDDGINAAKKSSAYTPTFMVNGGNVKINMERGDTDGIDSNGDIIINGGTIDVTGSSTFDYDGKAEHNGGTIIINGEEVDTIPNQFMGGMPGGRGGQGFSPNMRGNFSGDFNGGMTPPDFNGNSNGKRIPREFSGDMIFEGKKSSKDFKKQKTEQNLDISA